MAVNARNPALPSQDVGGKKVPYESLGVQDSCEDSNQYPFLGSLSGVFQQSAYLDFEMREPSITFCKKMILEMTIANANVAAATLINALWLIERVELYIGSNLITTYYAENNWYQRYCQMDSEKTALNAATSNFTAATYDTAGNTIGAGSSATYQIPISTILDQQPIPLPFIRPEYFRIRVYFRSGTAIFDSGSAHTTTSDITMSNLGLYCIGKKVSGQSYLDLAKSLETEHLYHAWIPERQEFGLGATATAAFINETLTSFNGRYCRLCCFIRAQNATQESLYQIDNTALYALDNLTLLDSNRNPYMQQQMSEGIIRYQIPVSLKYNSTFLTVFPAYFWNFSAGPVEATTMGSIRDGSKLMNGNWQFQAITQASAGNNLNLVVLGERYLTCSVKNGRFYFQQR